MAVMRKPVSKRRYVKSRKATLKKRTYTPSKRRSYAPIDTNAGTNPANLVIHRGIGFPDRFRTKLVWSDSIALSGFSLGLIQNYVVRMNGPYDPQQAVGGTQPTYFDQLATLYRRYFVRGSKITVTFGLPTTTTAGDGPYIVGIQTGINTTLPTSDIAVLVTAENCGHKLLTAGAGMTQVTQTYSPLSVSPDGESDGATAAVTGVPSREWFANVFASPQGTSVSGSVNAMIMVEYLVDFFELQNVIDT